MSDTGCNGAECNVEYINYLLFSVLPDSAWGEPMVRPRCSPNGASVKKRCHAHETEHLRRLNFLVHLHIDVTIRDPAESVSRWLFCGEESEP